MATKNAVSSFAKALRTMRLRLALKQAEMAKRLSVARETVSIWETSHVLPFHDQRGAIVRLLVRWAAGVCGRAGRVAGSRVAAGSGQVDAGDGRTNDGRPPRRGRRARRARVGAT